MCGTPRASCQEAMSSPFAGDPGVDTPPSGVCFLLCYFSRASSTGSSARSCLERAKCEKMSANDPMGNLVKSCCIISWEAMQSSTASKDCPSGTGGALSGCTADILLTFTCIPSEMDKVVSLVS